MGLGAEDAAISGQLTLGNIPDVYLKRSMDKLGKLILISRFNTRFLNYCQHKFGLVSKRVSTFEPRIQDVNTMYHYIQVAELSTTTSATEKRLKVLNKYGKATVKVNDILMVDGLFYNPSNTTKYSTTFGVSGGEYFTTNELTFVTAVGEDDAAGSGYTYIDIRRGWSSTYTYPGYATASLATEPTPAPITTDYKLFLAGNAFPHGTGSPAGDFRTPYIDGNYLQEMKWSVEITKEMELEKSWLSGTEAEPITLQDRLKANQFMQEYEKWLLFSQKVKSVDSKGNPLYSSCGMIPYMKADATHLVDYSRGGTVATINWMDLNTMCDSMFSIGGSSQKTLAIGHTLLTKYQNAFFNKFMFTNVEITDSFHIPVSKIIASAGELDIVGTTSLNELGWTNRGMVWDFSVPFEKYVMNGLATVIANGATQQKKADWDMVVLDHVEQKDENVHKKVYMTIGGFQFRATDYHCLVYGFPDNVAKYTTESAL